MNTDRLIKHKGLVHNVLNDAPFIGAIIIANQCSKNCPNCINQHLKGNDCSVFKSAQELISCVKKNGLNQGIILSGLEWTEQADDLSILVSSALNNHLQVMIYTHLYETDFFNAVPQLRDLPIYVKFGPYDPTLSASDYYSHTVKLATTNQYIKYFG